MVTGKLSVAFFFDCGRPESLLAVARLAETALRTGAAIDWRPILPEDLPASPVLPPSKLRYLEKDLRDWARFCGVRLAATLPDTAAAVAAAHFLASLDGARGQGAAAQAWLLAAHQDGDAGLGTVATLAGLTPDEASRALADPGARELLRANARALLELGGWRTPAFAVASDLYVGHERISLLELALTEASDQRLVPPGAHSQGVAGPTGTP